ncbi:hypothetical protein Tco_0026147 [Tanacetum coccineum]
MGGLPAWQWVKRVDMGKMKGARENRVDTERKKEKVDVAHGKGIELLSEVALTEKAQLKEVRKKRLRDFHKTHPSGSGTVAEKPPSVEMITPTITSEGTDDSNNEQEASDEGSGQENESEEQESDLKQDEESDDDNQEEDEVDQENESEDDEIESDEDKGMDDTTDQFDDDVDARLERSTQDWSEKERFNVWLFKGTKSSNTAISGKSVSNQRNLCLRFQTPNMPQDQEGNMGDNEDEPRKETASRQCYKALSEKLDWENPEGGDYPFDLSKPLPLITHGKRQKTKAAQYDLPSIEDMVPNIWSPVKRYAINGRCVFNKAYSGSQSGLGNDNILYKFKEGDFPRLWINDIEDMFLLVVQNRLNNLLGDDVADFVIALRMYTRSLVIQKHPYTPYKDPQGFIYVNNFRRNRLMRLDKLYKFSDGTLTRLLSLLKDITKNINMTYLPNRKWSTFEKKRAHFIIKDINKLLKERKIMRSLEKFVGGRLYGTDLRLLQRTI